MGELSQNEILILIKKIQTNENEIYIEEHVERVENENVQTKNSRIEENGEQIMKKYCKNYMFKEKFGKGITKVL
jgi:mannitol-1-phosphate/altronate dehydrogenase